MREQSQSEVGPSRGAGAPRWRRFAMRIGEAPMPRSLIVALFVFVHSAFAQINFIDATEASGLPLMNSARLSFADLDGDGRADIVARVGDRYRVFVNRADEKSPFGFRFTEIKKPSLPTPIVGDVLTFADLDNDGFADAIFARYLDTKNPKFMAPTTQPTGTCWMHGNGDGTFGAPKLLEAATRGTTACIAVGDANCDGLPDILLGNWYDRYGESNTAYPTDLLLQTSDHRFVRAALPDDDATFDEQHDAGARPTYGIMFVRLTASPFPSILQLNYGRHANRLYVPISTKPLQYEDRAVAMHLDGDANRDGKYPAWLKDIARTDKRFDRDDEKPFRSHGNTFDSAIGDVDGDGKFDLFFTEITHAWAGASADRSRFLLQRSDANGEMDFVYDPKLSVDRVGTHGEEVSSAKPPAATRPRPVHPNWNQGDLFASLVDLDQDGKLDLVLCSSDYPDPPPHENRLRIYHQENDGSFRDVTSASGIDLLGAQQPSWADLDGDGKLDLLVGQSFNRFTKEMIDSRTPPGPTARIYLNRSTVRGPSVELRLIGEPKFGITRGAYNTIVHLTTIVDGKSVTQIRQLIGAGGHNGKGGDQVIHFGLGEAREADLVRIDWPNSDVPPTVIRHLKPGTYAVRPNTGK